MNKILEDASNSDLGTNVYSLHSVVQHYKDSVFVDLGTRGGTSSSVLLLDSELNNNKVYGIDVTDELLHHTVKNHPKYNFILGDSVTIGKKWNKEKVDIVFIDTFHIKEQVLCELYFWTKHIKKNSCLIFHDCNWPEGKHDVYGNITWGRVEEAIKEFFNISDLNTKNEMIKSVLCPDSWGMCFVRVKGALETPKHIVWEDVFKKRNHLMSLFWNKDNINNVDIDLVI